MTGVEVVATIGMFVVMCFLSFCIGFCVGDDSRIGKWRRWAIHHGLAQYNPKTGDFEMIKGEEP